MLALQAANNETGVLQPVADAAAMVHAAGGLLVCDAVQAAGKTDCDILGLGADILVLSAHKFGGPKGAGALCLASDGLHIGAPLARGGGQERGLRAGTENVAAIAGFGAAAAMAGNCAMIAGSPGCATASKPRSCASPGMSRFSGGSWAFAQYILLRDPGSGGTSLAYASRR